MITILRVRDRGDFMPVNGINQNLNYYQNIASGTKINSARDDAAGTAISAKQTSQINGMKTGIDNAENSKNMLKTAEGGTAGINNQLLRMRELAVKSQSGVLSAVDKKNIQLEITQLKDGINNIAEQTQFNTQKLLNGNVKNLNLGNGINGRGNSITINGLSTKDLGIEKLDVTKEFNLQDIDKAIEKVNNTRGSIGITTNRINSNIKYTEINKEQTTSSNSQINGTDVAKEMLRLKNNNIIEQIKAGVQNKGLQSKTQKLDLLL